MDRQTKLLPLIAAFKIGKACLLFTLAFGLHHLRGGDAQTIISDWAKVVRVDPESKYSQAVISKVTGLPAGRLHELGIGTFFYGLMFGIEGLGLLAKQRWAEYMTCISTALFLPLEIFELIAKPGRKELKAIVLLLNIAILVYLVVNLVKAKQRELKMDAQAEVIG